MKAAETPQYQPPPEDPQTTLLKQRAEADRIAAMQDTVRMDSASLLARYGTMVARANATGSGNVIPTVSPTLSSDNGIGNPALLSTLLNRMAS